MGYWFIIEPYVFFSVTDKKALLYNTLDNAIIETDKIEVVALLKEVLQEKNHGVVFLQSDRYMQKNIYEFIKILREKFMGDIIDIRLSNVKPIHILPYFEYFKGDDIYRKRLLSNDKNVLEYLSEINIYIDSLLDVDKLISFLSPYLSIRKCNLKGDPKIILGNMKLLMFLSKRFPKKSIQSEYKNFVSLNDCLDTKYQYKIDVHFPLDREQWTQSMIYLKQQVISTKYTFYVASENDYVKTEELVEEYNIDNYEVKPIFLENNIEFFENYVFLNKDDILSNPISIKDIFTHQAMNPLYFGKINITSNGNVYANINYPVLGNIATHSLYDIVYKELKEGNSWLDIRRKSPCNKCVYQWLCPSPSDYEIQLNRSNLCHIISK